MFSGGLHRGVLPSINDLPERGSKPGEWYTVLDGNGIVVWDGNEWQPVIDWSGVQNKPFMKIHLSNSSYTYTPAIPFLYGFYITEDNQAALKILFNGNTYTDSVKVTGIELNRNNNLYGPNSLDYLVLTYDSSVGRFELNLKHKMGHSTKSYNREGTWRATAIEAWDLTAISDEITSVVFEYSGANAWIYVWEVGA